MKLMKKLSIYIPIFCLILVGSIPVTQAAKSTYEVSPIDYVDWYEESYTKAVGTTQKLKFLDATQIQSTTWTSSDETIVTVANGKVTAVAVGSAIITLDAVTITGDTFTTHAYFTITDPQVSTTDTCLNVFGYSKYDGFFYYAENNTIDITGLSYDSEITVKAPKKIRTEINWGYEDNSKTLKIIPKKKGDYTITVKIDGRKFKIAIHVDKYYFTKHERSIMDEDSKKWNNYSSMLIMSPKEKLTLEINGAREGSKVTYTSSDPTIVKVGKKGVVKAKKFGYAEITATVDGISLTYKVGVTNPTSLQALLYATDHYGCEYSQEKRMEEGYYDCSSFVWRSHYETTGVILGDTPYWATPSYAMAEWCIKNGYMMYEGYVTPDKLLPGDLIFFTGQDNGRFKGIYHVELYQGYGTSITVDGHNYLRENIMVARPINNTITKLKVKRQDSGIQLKWTKLYKVTGYQVFRSTKPNGKFKKIATVKDGNTYIDTNTKAGTTYYYKVRPLWKANKIKYTGTFSPVGKS